MDFIEYTDSFCSMWDTKRLEFLSVKDSEKYQIDGNGWYATDGENVAMVFEMQLQSEGTYSKRKALGIYEILEKI